MVTETFPSIDIRISSVESDLSLPLQPSGTPPDLTGWASAEDALLWINLHEPIPDPPAEYTEWVFAIDLDGDTLTGRPPGSAAIDPDLGTDAAIGLYYNPFGSNAYATYFLVWDPVQSGLVPMPGDVTYIINESRTLIGLSMPLDTLTGTVFEVSGVTFDPALSRGRSAALQGQGETRVIDFYPNRP